MNYEENCLKKPDLSLQSAHDYCRTFEPAEQQKFKCNVPTSAGTELLSGIRFVKKSNVQGNCSVVYILRLQVTF